MTDNLKSGVDINVPVATAYNQWTQFEEFPRFMRHVESVRQLDATHLLWRVNLGGSVREFTAEIVEQIPDQRIAWKSTNGPHNSGVVTFHRLSANKCRVMLQLEFEPDGLIEKVGTFVGVPGLDIEKDLARFVEFVEKRGGATGAWRGQVPNKDSVARAADASPGNS
ncbi:MAG: putative membrane protein [Planctomycetota bacterium]|jgi:uncharacterized membrane protein